MSSLAAAFRLRPRVTLVRDRINARGCEVCCCHWEHNECVLVGPHQQCNGLILEMQEIVSGHEQHDE